MVLSQSSRLVPRLTMPEFESTGTISVCYAPSYSEEMQKLAPGRYQIKFIVDGNWNISPSLPTVYDERGILNNEVTVAGKVSGA